MQSALAYGEFYDPEKLQIYFDELAVLLKDRPDASRVEVFRHAVWFCEDSFEYF